MQMLLDTISVLFCKSSYHVINTSSYHSIDIFACLFSYTKEPAFGMLTETSTLISSPVSE